MANKNPNRENLKPFKPGQSGNPAGGKVGQQRSTVFKRLLAIETKSINELTGQEELLTQEELMAIARINEAKKEGGSIAHKLVLDSTFGNTRQEIDLVGEIKITDHRLTIEVVKPKDDDDM